MDQSSFPCMYVRQCLVSTNILVLVLSSIKIDLASAAFGFHDSCLYLGLMLVCWVGFIRGSIGEGGSV